MKRLLLAFVTLILSVTASYAQGPVKLCFTTDGNNCVPAIQASGSVPINTASATTSQLVPLITGKKIYVTAWDIVASGTTSVTLVYGTGANCGTGQQSLTGPYAFIAQAGIAKATGLGPVLFVPAGNALCITNSAAIQISGSLSYAQF